MKLLRFLSVFALAFTVLSVSLRAASLTGETVSLRVNYTTTTQESVAINEDVYTTSFVVGGGVEVSSQPISVTYTSGGFPQTMSGSITVDVSGNGMTVNFSGTQQPGSLAFILTSVKDESASSITSVTETSSSGIQSGINMTLAPSFSNTGNGSITGGLVPFGFQPGVNISQTISFVLADAVISTPTVSGVSPTSGPAAGGTSVTISGTNFTGTTGVTFGGTAATGVTVVNSTTITATAPAHAAGAVNVAVTNSAGTSTANSFYTYIAAPTVTGVSPTTGPSAGGTSLTITGTGFTGATALTIGGTAPTSFTVNNSTTITTTAPAHAGGAVNIVVTTPGGTGTGTGLYTYFVPTVTAVSVPADGTAKLGDNLDFTINWSAAVTVTGTPTLGLTIGSTSRSANYVSGSTTSSLLFRYTVQAGDLDADGITVGTLAGTIRDAASNSASLTLNSVGSTANVNVDGVVPTLSPVAIVSSNSNTARARTGDVITLTFTSSEPIATPTVTIAGHAVTATNVGNNWTATYTTVGTDTEGVLPFSIALADAAGNAGTSVTATTNASSVTFDKTAPTVTAARISVTGATGVGGVFKIGDTLTVTWNNSASGDNNADVATVLMNLSQLGGGAAVTATNAAGFWSASFTVTADGLDAVGLNAVLTLVRDTTGNSTVNVSGTNSVSVDNEAPVVTAAKIALTGATGVGGVYKIGDTVTATWDNTATGDNNADTITGVTVDFTAFGGGSAVAATNAAGTWTATYTIVAGAVQASNLNVVVTATDNAGNTTPTTGTNNAAVDNIAPAAPSVPDLATASDSGSSSTDNQTNVTTPVFTGTAAANSTVRLYDGATLVGSAVATGGVWSITSTALATGTHSLTATATDEAGNTGTASGALSVLIDFTAPAIPVIGLISTDTGASSTDAVTNDNTLSLTGTAEAGSTVTIFRNGSSVGTALANGSSVWTFDYTGTVLPDATYNFTATATDVAGNTSGATGNFPVVIDTVAPVITATTAPGTYNVAFTYTISAPGTSTYASTALPAGLSLNATSGVISGTPTAAGDTVVTLTATDLAGNASTAPLTISIAKATPIITWATPANILYGTALSATQLNATATISSVTIPGAFVYSPALGVKPPAGSQTLSVAFTPTDTANYNSVPATTVTLVVDQVTLTVSGVTAAGRIYDGTLTAPLGGTPALVGVLPADVGNVTLTGTAVGTFANKNIGAAKPITVTGLSLTGSAAANYSLTQPTGLSATVSAKTLTVSGITANSRPYNGSTVATLNLGSAALVGIVSPDVVTPVTSSAAGAFATATVGYGKTVTITGITLGGAGAGNYDITQPSTVADITPANVAVTISNLAQTYDGTPKAATVTVVPAGTSVVIVYSNVGGLPPTNAGSYFVSANITDPNYSGSATATLVIARAPQTIAFAAPTGTPVIGTPLPLSATASTGLPVTFSVVSGAATVSGASLIFTGGGSVVVRATQGGNSNYLPASAEVTISSAAKAAQTIAFAPLPNRRATDPAFSLSATASSGLPVSFAVTGPATFDSATRTLTLTGVSGAVTVTASQAGDATFLAATSVTQSFNVLATGQQIFVGLTQNNDNIVVSLSADGKSGTLLCFISSTGELFFVNFTVNGDGTFTATVSAINSDDPDMRAIASLFGERAVAANGPRTFTGRINGGSLTGSIPELGVTFSTTAQAAGGPSADIAGLYLATAVNSTGGSDYFMVGPQGTVTAFVVLPSGVSSGTGTIAGTTFTLTLGTNMVVTGSINPATTAIAGTVTVGGQVVQTFAGTGAYAARTDRLVNLSSRVRIAPAAGRSLITGFVIGGTESKRVLLRAVGPSLTGFGVTGALVNPKLQLFDASGKVLLENDDWSGTDTSAAFTQVGAFALSLGTKDAAVLTTLAPGAYSMQVTAGAESGAGLAEIYDASATAGTDRQRLINISTRGTVDVGTDGLLIGGFVLTGNAPKKVLIRGVGPGLAAFGVAGALGDPRLAIYSGSTLIAQNDDWSTAQPLTAQQTVATAGEITAAASSAGAFAYNAASKDAAILVTLAPGAYTAQVSGAAGQTGVALVEIYEVP